MTSHATTQGVLEPCLRYVYTCIQGYAGCLSSKVSWLDGRLDLILGCRVTLEACGECVRKPSESGQEQTQRPHLLQLRSRLDKSTPGNHIADHMGNRTLVIAADPSIIPTAELIMLLVVLGAAIWGYLTDPWAPPSLTAGGSALSRIFASVARKVTEIPSQTAASGVGGLSTKPGDVPTKPGEL